MGIRVKFIIFLLAFGFVVLGTLVWSNQFVLQKTMLHYVDQRDQQRLERLKNNTEVFLEFEPINDISEMSKLDWQRLMFYSHRIDFRQMPTVAPKLMERFEKRRKLPPLDEFEGRVTLMKPSGEVLYGQKLTTASVRLPIVENGRMIAQIGYHPLSKITEQTDIEFANSQFKMFTGGAVLITLLALFLLWPLGNHFLKPVRQLNRAMHRLAAGNLDERLDVKRKDEIGALQRDFNHLAATLEAAQSSRNQWIADISHELRTPLTVINGSIEAMYDGVRPLNHDSLQLVQKEVAVLQRLIEDLYQLSLSDVGALQYSMQRVDLAEITVQCLEALQNKAQQKGVSIDSDIQPEAWIYGDANRLMQLVSNLLSNSLNYTDAIASDGQAGKVKISLSEYDESYQLRIFDSSPGVTAEELTRLTDRFYRTDPSRNRRTGGAGLGLAMVSQIAKAHDAELHLYQSDLGGLEVVVEFAKELTE